MAAAAIGIVAVLVTTVTAPGPDAGIPASVLPALSVAVLAALSVHDLGTRRIPNRVVYPAIAGAALLAPAWPGRDAADLLAGGVAAGAVFWCVAIASRGGLGGGDVKLAVFAGLVTGASRIPAVLAVTAVAGGVAAVGALALGHSRRATFAYGPCIALGGIAALLG